MELNKEKLLLRAEVLLNSHSIDVCPRMDLPIQDFVSEEGIKYQLIVVLTSIPHEMIDESKIPSNIGNHSDSIKLEDILKKNESNTQ